MYNASSDTANIAEIPFGSIKSQTGSLEVNTGSFVKVSSVLSKKRRPSRRERGEGLRIVIIAVSVFVFDGAIDSPVNVMLWGHTTYARVKARAIVSVGIAEID